MVAAVNRPLHPAAVPSMPRVAGLYRVYRITIARYRAAIAQLSRSYRAAIAQLSRAIAHFINSLPRTIAVLSRAIGALSRAIAYGRDRLP